MDSDARVTATNATGSQTRAVRLFHIRGKRQFFPDTMESSTIAELHPSSSLTPSAPHPIGLLLRDACRTAVNDTSIITHHSTAVALRMGYKIMCDVAERVFLSATPEEIPVAVEIAMAGADVPLRLPQKLAGWREV